MAARPHSSTPAAMTPNGVPVWLIGGSVNVVIASGLVDESGAAVLAAVVGEAVALGATGSVGTLAGGCPPPAAGGRGVAAGGGAGGGSGLRGATPGGGTEEEVLSLAKDHPSKLPAGGVRLSTP